MIMMKWFHGVTTVDELRKEYKKLLLKHHPDNGGLVSDMQEISAEYDRLFADLSHDNKKDEESSTNEENEQFKAILNEIVGFNMTIEIIGSWLWCFDCFQYKEQLKTLGFKWCGKKKAWVWHTEPYSRHHRKDIPLSQIRAKYGSEIINKKSNRRIL